MKIVVLQHRSAGNDSVGSMWHETKIVDDSMTIKELRELFIWNYDCQDIIIPKQKIKE